MPQVPDFDEEARICATCVGEPYLSSEIERSGLPGGCDVCGEDGQTYTLAQMSDRVEEVMGEHFRRTPTDPDGLEWAMIKEGISDWEREGDPTAIVIMNLADIPEAVAEAIQVILDDRYSDFEAAQIGEETEYDSEAHYTETRADMRNFEEKWSSFERSIKGEARFFGPLAEEVLRDLFHDVHAQVDHGGHSVVREIGPGSSIKHFHRARVFQSEGKLREALENPERFVGTPSSASAANGRMNARGVAVFYGATSDQVALKEVRPPVGSRVVTAKFEILNPLRVLDLAALQGVHIAGSLFDPSFGHRFNRAAFLRRLSERIVAPVMPDDEATDYLVTQVMAEYLAHRVNPSLDGILYPSAQNEPGEQNVVLFHHAARVKIIPQEPDAIVSVKTSEQDEEDVYPSYAILKELSPKEPEKAAPRSFDFSDINQGSSSYMDEDYDLRNESLRLDRGTLKVRHIDGIQVFETAYNVAQHTWTRSATLGQGLTYEPDVDL